MRIAIVEDEDVCAAQMTDYIARYQLESGMQMQVTRFTDGAEIIGNYTGGYDVILMDIQMASVDGMSAAEEIRKVDTDVMIIFITNMAQFAIQGYAVDALDYVIKPISYFMFSEKLRKAERRMTLRTERYIVIHSKKEQLRKIDAKDLLYIEVQNHALQYHTTCGDYICSGNLKSVERELQGLAFARCNACYLVNLAHIQRVEQDQLVMNNGDVLAISRARRAAFMQILTDYYGGWGPRHV